MYIIRKRIQLAPEKAMFLFVNKMAYGYSRYSSPFSLCPINGRIMGSEPERGDVVVFRHPTRGVDFIKRVIGLPGDTVQVRGGRLWLNGAEVPLQRQDDFIEIKEQQGPQGLIPRCTNDPVPEGGECVKERFTETLPNGVSHDILNIVDGWVADDTPTFTVPEEEIWSCVVPV